MVISNKQINFIPAMMDTDKKIKPLGNRFDFSEMPSWYVLCTNSLCPYQVNCLRFQAARNAPENVETAMCVLPKVLNEKENKCRWMDKIQVVVMAAGFEHLYDYVMKKDYTPMRKGITDYLHGPKAYYEYKRGDRPLTPEQQEWINNFVRSFGYDWEVIFDRYYESYAYHRVDPLEI